MSESPKEYIAAKDKKGVALSHAGSSIINPILSKTTVEGLTTVTGDVTPSERFGDSGDMFNHMVWRGVMPILWGFEECHNHLVGMATMFLMRGKEIRSMFKGRSVSYSLPLPPLTDPARKDTEEVLGTGVNFHLTINFPNESSRVPATALTPERLKCLLRPIMVPEMIKTKRFPATSESIGYANLIRELMDTEQEEQENEDSATNPIFEEWKAIINRARGTSFERMVNSTSAVSGCFSSKEVYQYDEDLFPGCFYWSGVHALMTDASCRIKAPAASADVRPRLMSSAFYGDFKRKMSARGISAVFSQDYMTFLSLLSNPLRRNLRAVSGVSADENEILDSLVRSGEANLRMASQTSGPADIAVTGRSAEEVKESLKESFKALFSGTEEEPIAGKEAARQYRRT